MIQLLKITKIDIRTGIELSTGYVLIQKYNNTVYRSPKVSKLSDFKNPEMANLFEDDNYDIDHITNSKEYIVQPIGQFHSFFSSLENDYPELLI